MGTTGGFVDGFISGIQDVVLVQAAAQKILLLLRELPLPDLLRQGHEPGGVAAGDRVGSAGATGWSKSLSLPARFEEGEVEAATVR